MRDEVLELTDNLKCSKSPGPDGIHTRVAKELKYENAGLPTKICNFSKSREYGKCRLLKSNDSPRDTIENRY